SSATLRNCTFFFSSRRRHTRFSRDWSSTCALPISLRNLPVLAQLRDYRVDWLRSDVASGLSVAAVSLPSAIAYPAIAGLPTEFEIGRASCREGRQIAVGAVGEGGEAEARQGKEAVD